MQRETKKDRQSNADRLKEILEQHPDGMSVTYPDGTVINGAGEVVKKPKNKQNA